jgi:hypothetical protein
MTRFSGILMYVQRMYHSLLSKKHHMFHNMLCRDYDIKLSVV